jgi:hypothetical protein
MRFSTIRLSLWLVGLLAGLSTHRAVAQVAAPTQGGSIKVVLATSTTMDLQFGNGGTGQGRVVAIAATSRGAFVPLAAVDGQFYTGASTYGEGSELGQGYVVYNGTGNTTTVTGLKPNTYYFITNAEYNTAGSAISYNTRGSSMSASTRNESSASPLPVELTSFTGNVNAHNVATLYWTTASERNTNYFAVERAVDGIIFREVGRLSAASNSNQILRYTLADAQVLTQTTYYRLRQVDNDGTTSYSNVVSLSPAQSVSKQVEIYPNPSAGQPLNLLLQGYDNESITISLINRLGQSILTYAFTPTDAHSRSTIPVPQSLSSGNYILTILSKDGLVRKHVALSN